MVIAQVTLRGSMSSGKVELSELMDTKRVYLFAKVNCPIRYVESDWRTEVAGGAEQERLLITIYATPFYS